MACFSIERYQRPQKVQPINRKKLIGPNYKLIKYNLQNRLTKEMTPTSTNQPYYKIKFIMVYFISI